MEEQQILILEGRTHNFPAIKRVLEYKNYRVEQASTPEDAIEALVTRNFSLILADADADGIEIIKRAKKFDPAIKGILLVDRNPCQVLPAEAFEIDIDDYLVMPCRVMEFQRRVSQCLEGRKLEKHGGGRGELLNESAMTELMSLFHDIRGSLVSTTALLKLLIKGTYGKMNDGVADKLGKAKTRIEKVIAMTEEYLHKILAGRDDEEITQELLDLRRDVINPVLDELADEIGSLEITIDNRTDCLPAAKFVKGDKFWLKSVFRNLIGNAIKYGGRGCHILIDLEDRGFTYRLHVANSGRPIPEEYRHLLFEKLFTGIGQDQKKKTGLGLGLYLSRDIVKKHGGDLWYEPKHGNTDFVVALPHC